MDANGYYTSVKSINIQNDQHETIIFKLKKDERILSMPRMMFIALAGNYIRNKKFNLLDSN